MALKITTRDQGAVTVVVLDGRLDGGPETGKVHETIRDLLAKGRRSIVLDLAAVPWANSLGIGILISAYATAKREQGTVALCAVPERVLKVLKICGVVPTVFEVHDDAAKAVATLS
jgi:anti-anti-sigma factor